MDYLYQVQTLFLWAMDVSTLVTTCFIGVIFLSMVLDLGVFSNKKSTHLNFGQSLLRTVIWFTVGLSSVGVIYLFIADIHHIKSIEDIANYATNYGVKLTTSGTFEEQLSGFKLNAATSYFTGFLLEYALSVDNLFVMLIIFQSFKISESNERRILVWGILGAMILRFLFVIIGATAISHFHWVLYGFGGLLVYSGIKLLFEDDDETFEPNDHFVMKMVKKVFPVSTVSQDRGHFFHRENGVMHVTILFVVLIVVELTDVLFAIDSVPAVFGVTRDPYLVFFSNIFALIGLRSLYFLVGHGIKAFWALKYALSGILTFIGIRMIFESYFNEWGFNHIHNLIVILGMLFISILLSLIFPTRQKFNSHS